MRRLFCVPVIIGLLASGVGASQRVEIRFSVPEGLGQYTGLQPVTFGVPFEKGKLKAYHGLRIIDEQGNVKPAQFEVTATWAKGSPDVRWVLVDCCADIRNGRAQRAFLEFGPKIHNPEPIDLLTRSFETPPFSAEQFLLVDGAGKRYTPSKVKKETRTGHVKSVSKQTGKYVAKDGSTIAEFVTRFRLSAPIRAYHTLIWQTDASVQVGKLAFVPSAKLPGAEAAAGLDGKRVTGSSLSLKQTDWRTVKGSAEGKQVDGWLEMSDGKRAFFAALRWPWQQHPVQLNAANGQIEIQLIGPEKPMSLKAEDVAVDYVVPEKKKWNLRIFDKGETLWFMKHNGQDALPHVSPRGVAKTYELVIWEGQPEVPAEVKNVLAQHPVLAYADPAFAVKAALPSPASPADKERFPVIEPALERAFDWFTRENDYDGDFGTWNYGDVQWAWVGWGYTTYRYWMNHGKGWSILPWALWLRSGDRRYWEHGEANSRHCMDVDLCHVPEWEIAPDGKIRGGQYHYSALHWGYGPQVSTFYIDSEYLPYCYYVTGYERAKDVMLMRAEALARDDWKRRVAYFREDRARRSRHLYVVVKDLAALYEATWRDDLLPNLKAYLDLMLDAQEKDGSFLGIKTSHYLDQPLNIAARALPDEKSRILAALKRWREYQGDPLEARPGSSGAGPMALWTTWNLAQAGGDPRLHAMNVQIARGQAWCIAHDENIWRGLAPFPGHVAGPILRDWVIAMSGVPAGQTVEGLAPPMYLNAHLPVKPGAKQSFREGRHVVLALKPKGEALKVHFHLFLHNMGRHREHPVTVFGPDGKQVLEGQFTSNVVHKDGPVAAGGSFEVAAEKPEGVYLFLVRSTAPTRVQASSGKVVHYMPEGRRSVCSPYQGAQAWFVPAGGADVSIGFAVNLPRGRAVILDPEGKLVAASCITGTSERKLWMGPRQLPIAEPCRMEAAAIKPGLYCFLSGNHDFKDYHQLRGMKPWLSGQKSEWFDPTAHACADIQAVLAAVAE